MQLKELQQLQGRFDEERSWDRFPPSQVLTHLIEELGEIGRHILFEEGYKVKGLGHEEKGDVGREFAQVLSLFLHLANHFNIDLEGEYLKELSVMEKRFNPEGWKTHVSEKKGER